MKQFVIAIALVAMAISFGVLRSTPVSVQASGRTFYLDSVKGNDANPGTQTAPWKTLKKAITTIASGDTVILATGIYNPLMAPFIFGPAGAAGKLTTFKAAPGARPIITQMTDKTPISMSILDYVQLEGLWIGGIFDPTVKQPFILGHEGNVLLNNTFYGWFEGPMCGWCENMLIQGNRFVNSGGDKYSHAMYISSGLGSSGQQTNHVIVDSNLIFGGLGYGLHSWHQAMTVIWSRNFVAQDAWGGAQDGNDALWANNFFWKETGGSLGQSMAWGPLIGPHQVIVNNVFGPYGTPDVNNSFQQSLTFDSNAWTDVPPSPGTGGNPRGSNIKQLISNQELAQLGITATDLDNTVAALTRAFNQPSSSLLTDTTIEPNFAKIRAITIPSASTLYKSGKRWFDPNVPMDIGFNVPGPSGTSAFWSAYRALGLIEYDRYGKVVSPGATQTATRTGTAVPIRTNTSTPTLIRTNTSTPTVVRMQTSTSTPTRTNTPTTTAFATYSVYIDSIVSDY